MSWIASIPAIISLKSFCDKSKFVISDNLYFEFEYEDEDEDFDDFEYEYEEEDWDDEDMYEEEENPYIIPIDETDEDKLKITRNSTKP